MRKLLRLALLLAFLALTFWAAAATEFAPSKLREGWPYMRDFVARMWPPDFAILPQVFRETLLTIQLAWMATVLCAIVSLPIGFIAARNITKNFLLRRLVLAFLHATRAIDSLIWALFFVSAVGLGPFAGTLALAIHSVGMLGKLCADAIEAADQGPLEALQSAGGGWLAQVRWALWPQLRPHFVSFFLMRFELNVRAAVVLGLVGAGGIGFLLNQYMRLFLYQRVATVVLVILVLVNFVDFCSSHLRRSVL